MGLLLAAIAAALALLLLSGCFARRLRFTNLFGAATTGYLPEISRMT